MPQMNESKTGRCQRVTGWIQNHSDLDPTLYAQKLPSRALVSILLLQGPTLPASSHVNDMKFSSMLTVMALISQAVVKNEILFANCE